MSILRGFSPDLMRGKRVLVTGAAGGIGAAVASALAACGARLLLLDRADDALEALRRAHPQADSVACDLGDRDAIAATMAAVDLRTLDGLVNCAGVFERTAVHVEGAEDAWNRTLAVNLTAPFLLCRACLPALVAARGAIVNVTSVRARTAAADAPAYTVSKGGLEALTIALARDLGAYGVRVNAVAPGDVATTMALADPEIAAALVARAPLARMAQPEEVAAAMVFLLSPLAAFTTGATLHVDGGFLAA